jgi:hypothetical protein
MSDRWTLGRLSEAAHLVRCVAHCRSELTKIEEAYDVGNLLLLVGRVEDIDPGSVLPAVKERLRLYFHRKSAEAIEKLADMGVEYSEE